MIRISIGVCILFFGIAFFAYHHAHTATNLITPIKGLRLWHLEQYGDASGGVYQDGDGARIEILRTDAVYYHLQLYQESIRMKEGQKYRLSFTAKASKNRTINVQSTRANRTKSDYANTGLLKDIPIGTDWAPFEATFYATNVDGFNDRVPIFVFGTGDPATIWIKDVVLEAI